VEGKHVTFLDTPGHEAFTAMRARGAQVTDLVVLVIAADDRVMPQTVEAIDHARAAEVPIIVAINKIDLPAANPDLVKKELADIGLTPEEWGGKTICVEISAKTGDGVDRLLEMILLVAEMMELTAPSKTKAKGTVIESKIETGRGIVGTVLIQIGTLSVGDAFVAGTRYGRVRALANERRHRVEKAQPSEPVEVLGWSGTPQAGDPFRVVADDREARALATRRQQIRRDHDQRLARHVSLEDLHSRIAMGEMSELRVVIKGDVAGSVEALADSLTKVGDDEVQLKVIRHGVGNVSESDVLLAAASEAIIIGFHVQPDHKVVDLANRENVDLRTYDIIYEAVKDIKDAMSGMLKPEQREVQIGEVEVRQVFSVSRTGKIAGVYVVSGVVRRNASARLSRNGEVLFEGKVSSLKRFKEDVREVSAGFECGIGLEGCDDMEEGDKIEFFVVEEVSRSIE
jgi:translation initiation factor IF-2